MSGRVPGIPSLVMATVPLHDTKLVDLYSNRGGDGGRPCCATAVEP